MKKSLLGIGIVLVMLFCANTLLADFVCVPAAAFKGWSDAEDYSIYYGTGIYLRKTTTSGPVYADLLLPDGVVIKSIRLLCVDDGTSSLEASILRTNLFNGDLDTIFSVTSSSDTPAITSFVDSSCSPAASYRKVYNNACSYSVRVDFGSFGTEYKLYGVTVEYE